MMKKITVIIFLLIFSITINAQVPTVYAKGGETIVNWIEIKSEYEDPNYEGPEFAYQFYICSNTPNHSIASSTLAPQGNSNYYAKNLSDYDPFTAWVEGRSDYGIGEFFELNYEGSPRAFIIYNGYQKSLNSWRNNSRVKEFKVYGDNKLICYLILNDKMGGQMFELPDNSEYGYENFRFEIKSVYKGLKWKDVAISEINSKGCCFNGNTKVYYENNTISINEIKKGAEISLIDIDKNKITKNTVIKTAKQIHYSLLKISTIDKTVELTPTHPLYIKGYGFNSLLDLKKKKKMASYKDLIGEVKVLVWNQKKQKIEYQKLLEIEKINGEFETHTILSLEKGKTYIANGFITSVY